MHSSDDKHVCRTKRRRLPVPKLFREFRQHSKRRVGKNLEQPSRGEASKQGIRGAEMQGMPPAASLRWRMPVGTSRRWLRLRRDLVKKCRDVSKLILNIKQH